MIIMRQLNKSRIAFSAKPLMLLFLFALMPSLASAQCPDNNHPHMIDLGLPSGTLWACCNVGASSPEDYGGYYAWGETEEKESYTWENYIHADGEYGTSHDIGTDIAGTEYDVAHVKWKGSWQMPSQAQVKELVENCTREWETQGAINGYTFTGPNGNTIFVPVAGFIFDSTNIFDNNDGRYWTSSLGPSDCERAYYLFLNNENVSCDNYDNRQLGCSVRPIITTPNIIFADDAVKAICVENWDTDGDGELSYAEAAAVTSIKRDNWSSVFTYNEAITTFNELQYFTGLISIDYAFSGCSNLTSVIIPNGVTSVSWCAFYGCSSLTSVTIPNSVTTIDYRAFMNCSSLTSIVIPESVTTIEKQAFLDCENLASIDIGNSVNNIASSALSGTAWFDNQPDGLVYAGRVAYKYKGIMPDNTSIDIREGTLGISGNAFFDCNGLTSITIPNSVTFIGAFAFDGTSFYNNMDDEIVYLGRCLYSYKGDMPSDTEIVINEGTVSISPCAFQNCENLISVTIPNSLTTIGEAAFDHCEGLRSVLFSNSITSIGNEAFAYCNSLVSAIILESVCSIGNYAFNECSSISSVIIGKNVTHIGWNAFYHCSGLTEVLSYIEEPFEIDRSVFLYKNEESGYDECTTATLYVPVGTKEKYEATPAWNQFANIVEMESEGLQDGDTFTALTEEGVEVTYRVLSAADKTCQVGIWTEVIYGVPVETAVSTATTGTVTIPEEVNGYRVIAVGAKAFSSCGISTIHLPESIIEIKEYAFSGCYALNNFSMPSNVKVIESGAFSWCTSLESINIPSGVTSIIGSAFQSCMSLRTIVSEITEPFEIEEWAFKCWDEETEDFLDSPIYTDATLYVPVGCKEKYEVTFAWNKFGNIVEMENILFADDAVKALCVENWDTNGDGELNYAEAAVVTDLGRVFKYKSITSFNELQYFTGLTSIGEDAFHDCANLTNITIPNSVTSIDRNAFYGCAGLTSIIIPNTIVSLESMAFYNCSGLTSIIIPSSVSFIGYGAFGFCSGLTSITVESGNTTYDSRDNCNAIIATEPNELIAGCMNSVIPNTVSSIGNEAFEGCHGLTSIIIPNSVTSIGAIAFNECIGLTTVNIPNSVTSIGLWAFIDCTGLTAVTIPNSVTSIDIGAFNNCCSLTTVTIPESITSINNGVFDGCSSLSSVTIPESVTSIGWGAFRGCSALISITIPSSVTSIGSQAFDSCSGLTEIRSMIEEPFEINENVFQYRYTSATLYVPAGTKEKYEATPAWNLFENIVEMNIEPVEDGETVDFAEEIDEDTNLDGNVVGDIYYNISDEDGSYDAEEGCIVVTTPTDDDTMSELEGQDIFGEDFKDGFTGIVFKVAPGKGTINVEAQTTGSMVLKVKIGNAYPITKELEGKLKVTFPYNVAEETYVYIYGGNNATQAKGMKKADANGELRIYGIEIFRNTAPTDIDSVTQYPISNQEAVYDLQGRKIGTDMHEASPYKRGINIMRLGDGTTRKVVVK